MSISAIIRYFIRDCGLLCFLIGICTYFFDDIGKIINNLLTGVYKDRLIALVGGEQTAISIKPRIKNIINSNASEKKQLFFVKAYNDMVKDLRDMGNEKYINMCNVVFLAGGVIGAYISYRLGNIFIAPVLIVGMAMIPTWVIKLGAYSFRKRLNSELSVTLSAVTSSYIRNNNIVKAAEENIPMMRNPVKQTFENFVNRYQYIDKDLKKNIRILSDDIDNKIFKQWCQELIICQDDASYKTNLTFAVSQFAIDKELQQSLAVQMSAPLKECLIIVGITFLLQPLLKLFGNDAWPIFINSLIGKVIYSGMWLRCILGLNKAVDLQKPVE